MSSFSTGHNEVNLARRANIRRVNRVSNAGRAVICPHPFASIHVRRGIEATETGRKKRINLGGRDLRFGDGRSRCNPRFVALNNYYKDKSSKNEDSTNRHASSLQYNSISSIATYTN